MPPVYLLRGQSGDIFNAKAHSKISIRRCFKELPSTKEEYISCQIFCRLKIVSYLFLITMEGNLGFVSS
jgi:hypothetical protein